MPMENLIQDVRFALRLLLKAPGFAVVVVLVLGLGIGANSAIFSVIDSVLLRPLPYEEPDRLVKLWMHFSGIGVPKDQNWVSAPEFADLRDLNHSFSQIAAVSEGGGNATIGTTPEVVPGASVSAGFFPMLGVQAEIGRTFFPDEDRPGKDRVVVLSRGLWERRYGTDRGVLGKSLVLNDISYTIIGVAPVGFQFPAEAEVWTPLSFSADDLSPRNRGNHGLEVLARIKPGISLEQARADMQAVSQRIIERNPDYPYRNFQFRVVMNTLLDEVVGDLRTGLWILMGAVGFVLLIACANVANLLLARATAREREIAVRTAIGAGRFRLVRQLLTESMILALVGSIAGILMAQWGLGVLIRLGSVNFPRIAGAHVDGRVLGFTALLALGTALVFGIVPALLASRLRADALKEGGRGTTAGSGPRRLRSSLVVAEIALSLILLVGAGLLIKSFFRLQEVDAGFRPDGVLTVRISLPENRYSRPEQIRVFIRDLMARTQKLPGVEAAGGASSLPLSGSGSSGTTTVDSKAVSPENSTPEADWRVVTPGYFSAMGIRLIRGRLFDDRDTETSAPVAIIDETLARMYWPGEDPIGKRLHRGGLRSTRPWSTIVGVVGHVRYRTLEAQSRVQLYWPYSQDPWPFVSLAVRTSMEPQSLANAVQREVLEIDPALPIHGIRTMSQLLAGSIARRKFSMLLLAIFAGVALTLAAVGIYGVISYMVTQRMHEIGIRLALGASHSSVLSLVMGQSFSLVLSGIVLGLGGSLLLTGLASSLLFNVRATDPATFVLVTGFLALVAVLASLLPAARATRVDPMIVLRCE
jgi:putative ABC transport system permease protein